MDFGLGGNFESILGLGGTLGRFNAWESLLVDFGPESHFGSILCMDVTFCQFCA